MPGNYAHYRAGMALMSCFPADEQRTIQRFRRLFDLGLHGPDIFLYHHLLIPTSTGELGSKYHLQTGREFFMRLCRVARQEQSEAAQAYIYGALCHYAIDSYCNPFIREQSLSGIASSAEIEAEFDRFLLAMDGKNPPESQDFTGHLQMPPGECAAIAKFYPPATPRQVHDALRSMTSLMKRLATPEGPRRTILRKGLQVFGPQVSGLLMTTGPNSKCAQLDKPLLEEYNRALEAFPELLHQLEAHLTYNGMFGEEFTKIFG